MLSLREFGLPFIRLYHWASMDNLHGSSGLRSDAGRLIVGLHH